MGMKALQNNFTTSEESKYLLKFGVPADSADCFYEAIGFGGGYRQFPIICNSFKENRIDLPCWSVGRLIEIFELCTNLEFVRIKAECSILDDILWQIETHLSRGFSFDFSKLEE